jgi:hypothetical protein
MNDPKSAWLKSSMTGTVLVMGDPIEGAKTVKAPKPCDLFILNDILQEVEDPIALLKSIEAPKVAIIVPNEYLWDAKFAPLTNKKHLRNYDADLLSEHLEAAGFTYVLKQIEFGGWVFLGVEATK